MFQELWGFILRTLIHLCSGKGCLDLSIEVPVFLIVSLFMVAFPLPPPPLVYTEIKKKIFFFARGNEVITFIGDLIIVRVNTSIYRKTFFVRILLGLFFFFYSSFFHFPSFTFTFLNFPFISLPSTILIKMCFIRVLFNG